MQAIAVKAAAEAGDEAAASTSQSVETTRGAAEKATEPGMVLPTELSQHQLSQLHARVSAGEKAWFASATDLVVMHGHFKLSHLPARSCPAFRPCNEVAPTGDVLVVQIDAHTGRYGLHVGDRPAPDLSGLPRPARVRSHQ